MLRYHHADTRMVMTGVIPGEKVLTKSPGIFDRAKSTGEFRAVLEGFELSLGKRVVIADMWFASLSQSILIR
jgi:hypothetical protein